MANVKNFGLVGVGSAVQFGKGNSTLSAATTSALRADGTAAFILPSGTNAQQPAASIGAGAIRYNSDGTTMEYSNGSAWVALATGGAAVTSVNGTADRITSSNTGAGSTTLDIAATYVGQASITTLGTVTTGTWEGDIVSPEFGGTGVDNGSNTLTLGGNLTTSGAFASSFTMTGATDVTFPTSGTLLSTANIADNAVTSINFDTTGLTPNTATDGAVTVGGTLVPTHGGTGLASFGSGSVLYASGANTWSAASPGATSGVQAWDADLDAVAGLTTTGYIVRTGAGTASTREIVGNAGRIVVTNGDGVASDTSIDLDTVGTPVSASFVKITTDAYGRVTATTPVVEADITALVDSVYVDVAGDTMTGTLVMSGGATVTGLPTPVSASDAANKAYVDATASGLSWKAAVLNATTGNVTLSGEQTIDGVLTSASRILVKNQTAPAENGIYVTAAGAWTRSTDADTPTDLDGAAVFVQQGTANGDTAWVQTNTIVTVGTTPVVWAQFAGGATYVGGVGIDITGNTISVNLGAGIVELPSDEIGIDVVSGLALQLTDTSTSGQLTFVLDSGSGLEQSAAGLKISAGGVTNAMLVNDGFTTNADTGTGTISLGEDLEITGSSVQGIATSVTGSVFTVAGIDASTTQKGVASFATANFAVTAGAVSIKAGGVDLTTNVTGVLPVANGGTGATTFVAGRVLLGNGTTNITEDVDLAFNAGTNTLTIGTATLQGGAPDVTLTATGTDGDIVLMPNGTGAVVVGPTGADGLIESDSGQALTVTGATTLTLGAGTGDIILSLTGTTNAVTVTGPTAAQYAANLADADLANKYYVDQVASAGGAGDVKAVMATVNLGANASTNIGAALPAGSTILSVKVNVTTLNTTSTLVVGKSGGSEYMTAGENDPQATGLYLAETMVTEAGSVQVQATVAGQTGGVGSCVVVVTYKLA